jgi:hypothetical protein
MFSEDGEVYFTDIPNCQDVTAQVKGDSIVSIVFQEGTNDEYYITIDQQPIEVYYTKEETDNLIDEKISEIDLGDVVHKSGAETITGNKDFRNTTPRFTGMYIGLGSRLLTYSNVGFDFEGMIQATSGRIEAEGLYSAMLVSGRAVWTALQAYLKTADIATTLDDATDDKVPSAKCVADALAEISGDDTNLVHKTGNETINGSKTFNNALNFYNLFGLTSAQDTYINITTTLNTSTSKPNLLLSSTSNNSSRLIAIINEEGISVPNLMINGYSLVLSPGSISFKKTNSTLSLSINSDSQLQSTAPMTASKTQLIGANDTELTRGMDVFTFVNDFITAKIASANEIGVVNQSFAQGNVQDITLSQTSHYKTTYVRVTCATQINIQVLTPNAVTGDILIVDTARCEAGGVCFRPVKYSSNAGYHAFDVCENTAVTYGSTNFQTLIKWYYNGTSWQRLEKTICGPLANVSD